MSNVPMTRPDEMLLMDENPLGSHYTQLEDGRILSVGLIKGGNVADPSSVGDAAFRISEDGGATWSQPFIRVDADGNKVGSGAMSIIRLSGKGLGLITNPRPPGNAHVLFWRSEDEGETWSSPVRATPERASSFVVSTDVMTRTSSGRIIIPVYVALGFGSRNRFSAVNLPTMWGKIINGQWTPVSGHFSDSTFTAVFVVYSDDDGRTWSRNEDGELLIVRNWNADFNIANEASVAEVFPGQLLMVMRTVLGRLYQSWSYDDGTTWSNPQPTTLAASPTPAYITSLPNPGHLLIVWNQHSEEEIKNGYVRSRLSSAVTRNGGSVWEFFQNVDSWHEETRVEPGTIQAIRPAEYDYEPGLPAAERESEYVNSITAKQPFGWRITYPKVNVMGDRVFVQYECTTYSEHPTRAEYVEDRGQRLKILPITWFYGGKEPADNPNLPSSEFVVSGE